MPNSLRARINKLAYKGELSRADADRIREALAKQIPKPRGWDKCDGEYICPHCGKPLLFDFDQVYCHRCGGALSEEE